MKHIHEKLNNTSAGERVSSVEQAPVSSRGPSMRIRIEFSTLEAGSVLTLAWHEEKMDTIQRE